MKTIYHYLIALLAVLIYSSCNNEWEDELYKNAISFAQNGVQNIHIRYKPGGKVTYQLPIVVSGSRENDKDYFVKVDVDKEPSLAQQYKIMSIPTLLVFKGGKETARFVGLTSKAELEAALQ